MTIEFDREFIIAVVNPTTDCYTELVPKSLNKVQGQLVFTYNEKIGDKQSWTMQPVLLVKVDRKYKTESVQLSRRLQVFSPNTSD